MLTSRYSLLPQANSEPISFTLLFYIFYYYYYFKVWCICGRPLLTSSAYSMLGECELQCFRRQSQILSICLVFQSRLVQVYTIIGLLHLQFSSALNFSF